MSGAMEDFAELLSALEGYCILVKRGVMGPMNTTYLVVCGANVGPLPTIMCWIDYEQLPRLRNFDTGDVKPFPFADAVPPAEDNFYYKAAREKEDEKGSREIRMNST